MSQAMQDDLDIRQLNALYTDAVTRRDGALWGSLWHEDAIWHFLGEPIQGREAILATWESAMAGFPVVFHSHHSGLIDVAGDTATCRWSIDEDIIDSDGKGLRIIGVYNDTCVRTAGGWLYAMRRFDALYYGPGTLQPAHVLPYPDAMNHPQGG